MPNKITDQSPNRRMVETLLRELASLTGWQYDGPDERERKRLGEEIDELTTRLLTNTQLKRLSRLQDEAHKRAQSRVERLRDKLQKVRQKYLANGVTPAVLRQLNDLVDAVNEGL